MDTRLESGPMDLVQIMFHRENVSLGPFPPSNANGYETNINYFLSSLPIVLEQVFGFQMEIFEEPNPVLAT